MLKDILPNYIYNSLNKLPYKKIQELRLRENNKVVVNVDGENFYLTHEGIDKNINYAIDVEKGLLQNIINRISNNSLYAINDQLVNGYTTIKGGIRLGVCGEIVEVNKEIKTIKNEYINKNVRVIIVQNHINNKDIFLVYDISQKMRKIFTIEEIYNIIENILKY